MEKLNLLIADSSEEFIEAMEKELQNSYQIHSCTNGKEALSFLCSQKPEVLLLDFMLPELDGLTLLNEVAEHGILPMVLATSQYLTDYIADTAKELGVSYIMVKPCDPRAAALRVKDLSRKLKPKAPTIENPEAFTTELLLSMSIPARLRGFPQLRDSIVLLSGQPDLPVTKEIYPIIASRYQCTREQVERTMRSAIEQGWMQGDRAVWAHYFPLEVKRPTNSTFLTRIAEELRIKAGRNQE